uniref:Uncharacterized protein n=1 Tax=Triticum urartu TaxID=4572 RepID=A0A8R7TS18_TRIUA
MTTSFELPTIMLLGMATMVATMPMAIICKELVATMPMSTIRKVLVATMPMSTTQKGLRMMMMMPMETILKVLVATMPMSTIYKELVATMPMSTIRKVLVATMPMSTTHKELMMMMMPMATILKVLVATMPMSTIHTELKMMMMMIVMMMRMMMITIRMMVMTMMMMMMMMMVMMMMMMPIHKEFMATICRKEDDDLHGDDVADDTVNRGEADGEGQPPPGEIWIGIPEGVKVENDTDDDFEDSGNFDATDTDTFYDAVGDDLMKDNMPKLVTPEHKVPQTVSFTPRSKPSERSSSHRSNGEVKKSNDRTKKGINLADKKPMRNAPAIVAPGGSWCLPRTQRKRQVEDGVQTH